MNNTKPSAGSKSRFNTVLQSKGVTSHPRLFDESKAPTQKPFTRTFSTPAPSAFPPKKAALPARAVGTASKSNGPSIRTKTSTPSPPHSTRKSFTAPAVQVGESVLTIAEDRLNQLLAEVAHAIKTLDETAPDKPLCTQSILLAAYKINSMEKSLASLWKKKITPCLRNLKQAGATFEPGSVIPTFTVDAKSKPKWKDEAVALATTLAAIRAEPFDARGYVAKVQDAAPKGDTIKVSLTMGDVGVDADEDSED